MARARRSRLQEPEEAARPEVDEREQQAKLLEKLEAIGKTLDGKLDEAIQARVGSGIEKVWTEDEEHYEEIDDKNRGHVNNQSKPPGQANPAAAGNESIVFPNITRPYVDAAAAKVGDLLLPTDERSWSIKETPVPELVEAAKGKLQLEVIEGLASLQASSEVVEKVAAEEKAHAQALIDEAAEKAKKAQTRIEDWHVESQWHAEVRKVIEDCTKIGSGVLKGPYPQTKRVTMYREGELVMQEEIKPVSKRIDPWNFFPDGACGESIHNGSYVFERDYITEKQLRALKLEMSPSMKEGEEAKPAYIHSQIDLCLEEGPKNKANTTRKTTDGKDVSDKGIYEIWYFTGQMSKEDMEAAGCECKGDSIPAIITMINGRVVKAALNPLDTGEFPYDVMPWQRRKNMPWGTGVSRQGRTPQQIVIAGTRAMLTNAGRAAGPIIVRRADVSPADGQDGITPWKEYLVGELDQSGDASKAVVAIVIPAMTEQLMTIVQFGMKLFEDVTGLPLLLQGQAGSAPDTLGGQQLVDRNASTVLRRVARTFDDCITEPHVRRYYTWLLQYGEDEEKGDYVIDARGSTALVERDLQKQHNQALLQAALNPAFGLDPKKTMEEDLRANNRNPKAFQLTEEQLKAQAEAAQQKPSDPALQVAEIRSKTEMQKVQANQSSDMAELKFKAEEAERQRQHERMIADRNERIEMMKLAQSQGISVAQIKADLAKTSMQLTTQKQLSRETGRGPQVARPAVEPKGRAPNGQAFPK